MTTDERRDLLDFAVRVAEHAGRGTLSHFGPEVAVERKADGTPVTAADRESERRVRAAIASRFPDDTVVGEEFGGNAEGGRRWIVDPIDGTKSFIHGVPLYGVLLALEVEGQPVIGVLHFPALRATVAAAAGLGCWWNGRRARVSNVGRLDQALVLTTGDSSSGPGAEADAAALRVAGWERLRAAAGMARTWGDAYGYALVATGRAEAMVDPLVRVWDVAPVRCILQEAGGVFTDWAGTPSHTSGHAIATNAAMADVVRATLTGASV